MTGDVTGEWRFPASFAQERVWLVNQLDTSSPVYNVPVPIRFPRGTTGEQVRSALRQVVRRHESLRTYLRAVDGALVQVVRAEQSAEPPVVDLAGLPAGEAERRLTEESARLAAAPIPLDTAPLWRARLFRETGEDWSLMFVAHHAVCDAASTVVFKREMAALTRAAREGGASGLPELPIGYADFSVWQRERMATPAARAHLDSWRELLAGAPPVTCPPLDRPRPARPDFTGGEVGFEFPGGLFDTVTRLARDLAATPYMVLLAAAVALLARLSGSDDVVVGVPTAGRYLPELAPLIGMFVNPVPVRVNASGDPTVRELIGRVRQAVGAAISHAETPFQRVAEAVAPLRDLAVQPIYQVSFNFVPDSGLPPVPAGTSPDELSFDVTPTGGRLLYRTALFDRSTAEASVDRYLRLLGAAAAAPGGRVSRLPLLTAAERHAVVYGWNDTAAPAGSATAGTTEPAGSATAGTTEPAGSAAPDPADATITALLERQAARVPDATALVCAGTSLTYAELHDRAGALAALLAARGAGPESVVALVLPRSPALVVAILATLKAGAAYLPVDPDHPAGRVASLLRDARPVLALATRDTAVLAGRQVLLLGPDGTAADPGRPRAGAALPRPRPEHAAYVIYTSGSTGQPKGVVVEHRAAHAYLAWACQTYSGLSGTVLLHSAPTFDLSVTGLFGTLAAGGTIRLAGLDEPAARRGGRPAFVKAVPGHLPLLTGELAPTADLVLGGENLIGASLAAWWRDHPQATVTNEYGPTEATVGCVISTLAPGTAVPGGAVPIGRPVRNMNAYVLDAGLRPVPPGVVGELYLAGPQLARGYLGSPALTAQRFLPCPYGAPGRRMYRSGDLARWRADGVLEFIGRADHQVKVNGVRIEPGEVDSALRGHPSVREAVTLLRPDRGGEPRLISYVVGAEPGSTGQTGAPTPAPGVLAEHLTRILPTSMLPSAIVALDRLPRTRDGKLDRAALPDPPAPAAGGHERPRGELEALIAEVYAEILLLDRVGRRDDFFALGGNSLRGMRALARIRQEIDVDVPMRVLFGHPVVADLAVEIERLVVAEVDGLTDAEVNALLAEGSGSEP